MPVTQVNSRSKRIEEVGICYTTLRDEANDLESRVSAISQASVIITQVGPALGAHGGPGAIGIALITKTSSGFLDSLNRDSSWTITGK